MCAATSFTDAVNSYWNMAKTPRISKAGWIDGDTELRKYARSTVDGAVTSTPVSGEVVDTSEGGLGVRTRKPLRVGDRNAFHIHKGKTRVRYQGEIRWCHFEDSKRLESGDVVPVYRSGVALYWPGPD